MMYYVYHKKLKSPDLVKAQGYNLFQILPVLPIKKEIETEKENYSLFIVK